MVKISNAAIKGAFIGGAGGAFLGGVALMPLIGFTAIGNLLTAHLDRKNMPTPDNKGAYCVILLASTALGTALGALAGTIYALASNRFWPKSKDS